MKYILVSGGVISGVGKGVVTSSIGALLKACNIQVTAIKIDPYINIDAGTFSPYEHGEVFVLNDGCEVDLDLGNYERFLDTDLSAGNNLTTGKIWEQVLKRERKGDYLGKTVQTVPHVTDTIQEWIENTAQKNNGRPKPEICIIELGGTVGDIESMPFLVALRKLQERVGNDNFCCCHVSPVFRFGPSKELKSKPTQQSVTTLKSTGLNPDLIICRSEIPITKSIAEKISYFSSLGLYKIFNLPDLRSIYEVPIELHKQGILKVISERLKTTACACDRLKKWSEIKDMAIYAKEDIKIALVGKYTALNECYTSVIKALEHACYELSAKPKVIFIESTRFESDSDSKQAWEELNSSDCLLVPGGFGARGTEGKISAIKWARENKIPFLGICLGFQMAVVEYARNVIGIKNANSIEFVQDNKSAHPVDDIVPVVIEMLEYKDKENNLGGTMRLGLRETKFVTEDSIVKGLYGNVSSIKERHRHRYEIDPEYIGQFEKQGLRFVGRNEDGQRMEILELSSNVHPYFVAVQYHPEYLSRPFKPSPPYTGLIKAARAFRVMNPLRD